MSKIFFNRLTDTLGATAAQRDFIAILAVDLGFSDKRRNAHVSAIVERTIHYLDELLKQEATKVINVMKAWKENEQEIPELSISEEMES